MTLLPAAKIARQRPSPNPTLPDVLLSGSRNRLKMGAARPWRTPKAQTSKTLEAVSKLKKAEKALNPKEKKTKRGPAPGAARPWP